MFRLLRKAKRYTLVMAVVVVFLFIIAMCSLMLPRLMASLIDVGITQGDNSYIIKVGMQMLGLSLISAICHIITNYFTAMSSMGFGRDLRSEVFEKITHFSLQQTDEFGTAALITRTASDVRAMQTLLQAGLSSVVSVPLNMIGGIIMALSMDVQLASVVVIAMPVMLAIIFINIKWVRPLFEAMRDKFDNVSRVLRENLSGVRVIRAFNTIDREHERFNKTNLEYTSANRQARHRMALINPATTIVISSATVAVYWFGQFRVLSGNMSVGDIMAFSQYVLQILGAVMGLQMVFNMIPNAMAAAGRLNQVLDSEPLIIDPKEPLTPDEGIHGHIRFENVTFRYPGAEKPVLENITFEALAGQTTAIIGGTGSGKSTIVSLIPRLYDIAEGAIYVDGVDVTQMAQSDLRSRIGFVTQKAQLFTGSVADNIRFGNIGASEDDITAAAQIAQADSFIRDMGEGYSSFVSQDATNLSGGQKQRVSIARVVAKRPEIYIFDDSFSAVDFKTDAALRKALREITGSAAVIIVAQRVSTIMDAERIVVIDEGKIVGQGSHEELMKTCIIYREIVNSQMGGEEAA
ncbi:MAG: ABC transporter ATP-binding protein/permease [Eubacteriaceae bacterium]|nr:ABC transporter ATP-binding protein/permease [Eubacteriaceae bacterium]